MTASSEPQHRPREPRLDLRPYVPGDEEAIVELFHASFGQTIGLDFWRWRFRDNPAGPGIIELAWDGDRLAAHYAVSPVLLTVGGERVASALSGTTMTHPDYRGLGLFVTLARRVYDRMREQGFGLVWGFPNANSHRGFVDHLGWTDIYEVPMLRRRVDGGGPLPSVDGVRELDDFDGRFEELWERVESGYAVAARRTLAYLRWRFRDNPVERYRIAAAVRDGTVAGYGVFKRYRDEMQVVDLLGRDETVAADVVAAVTRTAAEEGASSVALWVNVGHPLHRRLERLGFRNGEPVTYFGGLPLQPELLDRGICDYAGWHLTLGDSDVF